MNQTQKSKRFLNAFVKSLARTFGGVLAPEAIKTGVVASKKLIDSSRRFLRRKGSNGLGNMMAVSTVAQQGNSQGGLAPLVVDDGTITSYLTSGSVTFNVTAGQTAEAKVLYYPSTRLFTTWDVDAQTAQGRTAKVLAHKLECRCFFSSASKLSQIPSMTISKVITSAAAVVTDPTEVTTAQFTSVAALVNQMIDKNFYLKDTKTFFFTEEYRYDQAGSVWLYELNFTVDLTNWDNRLIASHRAELGISEWGNQLYGFLVGILNDGGQGSNNVLSFREQARYQIIPIDPRVAVARVIP
jgi:hypothetical protein